MACMSVICLVAVANATRVPQMLRLKGRFTDALKQPLTDTLPVRFSIWDAEDGSGNLLWEDIQVVPIQNNVFQVVLGMSKPLSPAVFSGGNRWVEIKVSNDAPLQPRHLIPSQYLQNVAASVSPPPEPLAAPIAAEVSPKPVPQAPVVTPAPVAASAPAFSDQEKRELELQIEKYKEAPPPIKQKPTLKKPEKPATPEPVYEVQPGDTLKSIAQKLYGNAELWYDLYYPNRDRLGPMGHLFPGQRLVVPAPNAGERVR